MSVELTTCTRELDVSMAINEVNPGLKSSKGLNYANSTRDSDE